MVVEHLASTHKALKKLNVERRLKRLRRVLGEARGAHYRWIKDWRC